MADTVKYEIRRGEFGWALEELKRGRPVRRRSGRVSGEFIFLAHAFPNIHGSVVAPKADRILVRTGNGDFRTWTPCHESLLTDDWEHADFKPKDGK